MLTLIFNLMCITITGDEIWNYGFAYNIATGLIPYKDFNMVVTPLFPIMSALFMKILGINIVTFHIFNAIICTTIFYYMKKHIPISHQELILSPETYMLALPQGLCSYHSLFLEHSLPQIMASFSLSPLCFCLNGIFSVRSPFPLLIFLHVFYSFIDSLFH